jgi:hypothetical protein
MPFGKHKGLRLAEVPADYLGWCLRTLERLDPWLRAAMEAELHRRVRAHSGQPPSGAATGNGAAANGAPGKQQLAEVLNRWFREQSRRWHPDSGGSDAAMAAINVGYERLKELLNL